ncbi:MAG TPA: DUF2817 domain-containing protein [Pseudobdellovibrionaceae bacterium]|nr:DUF2817 domain-containing protein [Pseudobdellovibrionaceae bacterium]
MSKREYVIFFTSFLISWNVFGSTENVLSEQCQKDLSQFAGKYDKNLIESACKKVIQLETCQSSLGVPIYHYDKKGKESDAKKILVFSLIHGDEIPAGSLGRFWMQRLEEIDSRNQWRIVPILNPDGLKNKTRTNARKVDLNRNFPTRDWQEKALIEWKQKMGGVPRRFPGDTAASEPETQCALAQIQDYKPDFVVSIHTPLTVLDFDGPKLNPPKFESLPWKSLGHFPGSLGRYLWFERETPVLTMELTSQLPKNLSSYENLQDIIGGLVKQNINRRTAELSALNQENH